jgi:putative peptidoglycan lipid II flippase
MVNVGILIAVLHRRLGGVDWHSVGRSAVRTVAAALPVILVCLWVSGADVWTREGEWIGKTVMLAVGIGLSVTGYVGVHALLRSEELDVVWGIVSRKIGTRQ